MRLTFPGWSILALDYTVVSNGSRQSHILSGVGIIIFNREGWQWGSHYRQEWCNSMAIYCFLISRLWTSQIHIGESEMCTPLGDDCEYISLLILDNPTILSTLAMVCCFNYCQKQEAMIDTHLAPTRISVSHVCYWLAKV